MSERNLTDPSSDNQGLVYFPAIHTHLIQSKYVQQTFQINVMQPPQKAGEGGFPVVYITDGNIMFDMCKSISWLMQASQHDVPRYILVSIGYPGDSPFAGNLLRGRDLTFPGCPDFTVGSDYLRKWDGVLSPGPSSITYCGAVEFQRFIGEELVPFIDANYATRAEDRTYFGHSAGGGFGLFTLFTRGELFRNYVVSSPTLSYTNREGDGVSNRNCDFMAQRVLAFAASGQALPGIQLYMSVGTEEELDPLNASWRLTSSFHQIRALIRNCRIPGLNMMAESFPGETHSTAIPIAFMHGLQAVFGVRRPSHHVY